MSIGRCLIRRVPAHAGFLILALITLPVNATLLVNAGFDGPEIRTIGDSIVAAISAERSGVWLLGGHDSNQDDWDIGDGPDGKVAANDSGNEGQGLAQWVRDDKATTGTATLDFDFRMAVGGTGDYDLIAYVFGWNSGDEAPGIDFENRTVGMGDSFTPNGAASLIADQTGPEGGLTLVENGVAKFSGVVGDGRFNRISINIDFGFGFDNLGVLFYAENGHEKGILELDNVGFSNPPRFADKSRFAKATVPEPGTLLLFALGALGAVATRRTPAGTLGGVQAPIQG